MGGDAGPRLTVPSTVAFLRRHPYATVRLFGEQPAVSPFLDPLIDQPPDDLADRLVFHACGPSVSADDKPAVALRQRRESSLWQALDTVSRGEAEGCVSAGNTGALMAMGMTLLGKLPGIDRPAICTALPTLSGRAYLLDMGANIECTAEHLVQFARMATVLVRLVDGKVSPRVALLNIGHEQGKGDTVVREAGERLQADPAINYRGFVEGDGIYSGDVDIVVCDGFVGNVALKSSEGVARMIGSMLNGALKTGYRSRLGAWLAAKSLKAFFSRIDPSRYNGASLLGLNGVVIKSHGGATESGFGHALDVALAGISEQLPAQVAAAMGPAVGSDSKG